jgi:hypothetical protein
MYVPPLPRFSWRDKYQNTPGGGADGVGDEYAISVSTNPAADQSAHR